VIFFKFKSINYCFIHIPKTAGISFQNTILKNELENKKYNLLFKNYMEKLNCKHDHVSLSFVKNNFLLKNKLNSEIKYITIIRNPWRRMASLFEQILLRDKVGLIKKLKNNEIRSTFLVNYESITNVILNELDFYNSNNVKKLFKFWLLYLGYNIKVLPNFNPNFNILPQSWWFTDEQTHDGVDKIFLFEDLESLEEEFVLKLSQDNKKQKYFNYRDYYDQEAIDYVYNLDKYIISRFSYDF
jgi:hypothetical protein